MPDKLVFYKKSADKPAGCGIHDEVADPSKYAHLNTIPDWRKKLDDFWVAPFDLDGVWWNTVHHAEYGYRASIRDPDYGYKYSLNSGDPLGQLNYKIYEHRHDVRLRKAEEAQWNLIKHDLHLRSLYLKFTTHPELADALLATDDAELWRTPDRGWKSERLDDLEQIRDMLRKGEILRLKNYFVIIQR